jgi:broad specificity phosphatase PhoE
MKYMNKIYFITHPEVIIDKNISITEWKLSEKGLERVDNLLIQPWINDIDVIFSSNENKAKIAAKKIADKLNLEINYLQELGEMDRSSTGFLEPNEFNEIVDKFFENPNESIKGWEKAVDVQNRIVKAIEKVISLSDENKNIAVIAHGGVGALLLCYLKNTPINRKEDQPSQGHFFVFDKKTKKLIHGWNKY